MSNRTCIVPANSRGGRVLVHDGFRYAKRNKSKSAIYWQCTTVSCRVNLHTNIFDFDDDTTIRGKSMLL